ncbi:MAG: hypothetical protein ACE15B_16595 [Bryobacteraceae bacterium]
MRHIAAAAAYVLFLETATAPAAQLGQLNIVVVEGEGAINNIRQRTAREAIVQVEDENRKPVAGAAVVFTLPQQGASGTFANGSRTLTMMTDQNGRAVARGIRVNNVPGRMEIRVTASSAGRTASATITQTNMLAAAAAGAAGAAVGLSLKTLAIIGAVAGAAIAGGVVAATRNGNGTTAAGPATRPPTTVSPGTGTVGPPR